MMRPSPASAVALPLVVIALALLPFVVGTFYLQLLTKIMILAISAMSLDLLVGFAGLVSLGHAAFSGLGLMCLSHCRPNTTRRAFG
jgi:branched-chain amino acid transport system permease protein